MPKLSNYCKAFLLRDIRAWQDAQLMNLQSDRAATSEPLSDDSVVFLQEDYRVTRTAFSDEQVLYDQVTPEWIAFCRNHLGFEVPVWIQSEQKKHS